MENDIRIALAICTSVVGRTEENLDRMEEWTAAARKRDASLICFPELNITGYISKDDIRTVAEPLTGPSVMHVKAMARRHEMTIIAGLAERSDSGGIFATQLVVDPTGGCGVYRKVHLGPPEKTFFSPAEKIPPVFDHQDLKFGVQLCYDAHFPELSTHMACEGAEALFMPHASPGKSPDQKYRSWMRHLPARAYDNGVFVLAVNPTGDNGHGIFFPGTAIVLSPSGEVISHYAGNQEMLLVADLSAEMLTRVRNHRMRYFFPNRRPELYKL